MNLGAGHDRGRGYTLVEVLVVCAIAAIVFSLTLIKLDPSSDRKRLNDAAEELVRQLDAARDDAVIRGRPVGFSTDGRGYQFWQFDPERREWLYLPTSEFLASGVLPEGVALETMRINGSVRPLGERLVLSLSGLSEIFSLSLAYRASRVDIVADALGRLEIRHAR